MADTASIGAAGHAGLAAQGLPDVVIANAGISVGMDTAERDDIDVMARTFAVNNTGMAATFHPFIAPMLMPAPALTTSGTPWAARQARPAATMDSTSATSAG